MDALTLLKKNLQAKARQLPDFDQDKIETAKIDSWADAYCDACDSGNDEKREIYLAALMLKFWYQIQNMYEKTKTCGKYDYEDYPAILYSCIEIACDKSHRAWRNSNVSAQACINQVIATRGTAQIMYESNLLKNRANAPMNQIRLDASVGDDDSTVADLFGEEDDYSATAARDIIQRFIDKDKIVEAVILDTIAFDDCSKTTSKSSEFWSRKCVQNLAKLPDGYESYFESCYDVNPGKLAAALGRIGESNTTKLHRFLSKTLASAKDILGDVR